MKELESLDAAFVIDTFLLLLIGIGPKIALVPFLDVTTDMPAATKRRVLRKMLTTAAIVAALLLILGGLLTRLLHFSPGALGVSSGIILLVIAIAMVLGHQAGSGGSHPVEDQDPMQVAVFPLAVPYLLNPSGIVVLVTLSAEASSVAVLAVAVGVLVAVLAFDVVVFRWAGAGQQQAGREPDAGHREGVRFPAGRARGATGAQRAGRCRRDPPDHWSLSTPVARTTRAGRIIPNG